MNESERVRVLTDRVSDIPAHLVEKHRIHVIPIYVTVNQEQLLDDGTISPDWYISQLATIKSKPKTAAPSPREFTNAFHQLVAEGAKEIVAFFASANMSSIYNHAKIAASEFTGIRIHIMDTQQISMGSGWLVLKAAEALQSGVAVDDVLHLVQDARKRTVVLGVLDSLDYLHKSGRVGWASAYVGDILKIKPLISFQKGEAQLIGKVRTHKRALKHIVDVIQAWLPAEKLAILHSGADQKSISRLKEKVKNCIELTDIPVVNVGPAFASHVGPKCLGLACVSVRTQ